MTRYEAQQRATALWGEHATVEPNTAKARRPIVGALVYDEWYVITPENGLTHRLDGNGHATCHKECGALEDRLDSAAVAAASAYLTIVPQRMESGHYRFSIIADPAPRTKNSAETVAIVITAALIRAGLHAAWREK
jgi:hypothetical protein